MFRYIQPLQFLLTLLAGWINRRQLDAIEYLKEENRLLKERLGGRRLRLLMPSGVSLRLFSSAAPSHTAGCDIRQSQVLVRIKRTGAGTNWQGAGVQPDVVADPRNAIERALALIAASKQP